MARDTGADPNPNSSNGTINSRSPNKLAAVKQLAARVAAKLKGQPQAVLAEPDVASTESGASDAAYTSLQDTHWRVHLDRRSVYFDLRDMDNNDPVVSTALDVIADCVCGYEATDADAFEWMLAVNDAGAKQVLEQLSAECDLGSECWHMTRGFVRNGEEFREVVVDQDMKVRRFKHLPSYQVKPVLDEFGNKQPGWEQRLDGANYGPPITFQEWQIVPFIYGTHRGYFGTGLMVPARRTWKRLSKMEDGMAIARMVRAYDRLVHKVPVPGGAPLAQQLEAIKNYRENLSQRRGMDTDGVMFSRMNPTDVPTDFYLPDDGTKKGGVDVLASQNEQLVKIDDVLYHQRLLLARTKVPPKYLGMGQSTGALTDGSLTSEDVQFARTLRQPQAVLRQGLVRLGTIALTLQGYDAERLGLNVNMPKISTDDALRDAKVMFTEAQAGEIFATLIPGGLPPELVMLKFMQLREDEKGILSAWITKQEAAEKKAAKATGYGPLPRSADRAAAARGRDRSKPDATTGVDAEQVAQALASLQMAVQGELERRGERFDVGRTERLAQARLALLEADLA